MRLLKGKNQTIQNTFIICESKVTRRIQFDKPSLLVLCLMPTNLIRIPQTVRRHQPSDKDEEFGVRRQHGLIPSTLQELYQRRVETVGNFLRRLPDLPPGQRLGGYLYPTASDSPDQDLIV
jgi:hypothetical protein